MINWYVEYYMFLGWLFEPVEMIVHVRMLSPFSHVQLFVTLWAVAHQAPLSMGSSRQEYWSGLPCPSPGGLPNPGIEPRNDRSINYPHCHCMTVTFQFSITQLIHHAFWMQTSYCISNHKFHWVQYIPWEWKTLFKTGVMKKQPVI